MTACAGLDRTVAARGGARRAKVPATAPAGDKTRRIASAALFDGGRLVVIEHDGSEYRLQVTGRGKLILTR